LNSRADMSIASEASEAGPVQEYQKDPARLFWARPLGVSWRAGFNAPAYGQEGSLYFKRC